ncbi:MAG: response regulator transcription factor [Microcoleaceae cyanobacterium]
MPLTILIVDDDLGTRLSITDYLEMSGYLVISAEDGQEALNQVEKFKPHLIVTDLAMPRMNGYELVRQVRTRPEFRLLPVIFLTAHNATQERVRGYQSGCDNYLPKPFVLEELGAVIRSLLDRSQLIESEVRSRLSETSTPGIAERQFTSAAPATAPKLDLGLTQREQQVLNLLIQGLSNIQIGDRLHLSPRTIEKYVSQLLRKTESSNRAELIRFALQNNLNSI